jgi:hypothetical protein
MSNANERLLLSKTAAGLFAASIFFWTSVGNAQDDASKAARMAISAECSREADARGLHGKARKEFRERCKTEVSLPPPAEPAPRQTPNEGAQAASCSISAGEQVLPDTGGVVDYGDMKIRFDGMGTLQDGTRFRSITIKTPDYRQTWRVYSIDANPIKFQSCGQEITLDIHSWPNGNLFYLVGVF